jgi:cytochrome c peroxidase
MKMMVTGLLVMMAAAGCEDAPEGIPALGPPRATAEPSAGDKPAAAATPAVPDVNPRLLRRFRPVTAAPSAVESPDVTLGRLLYFDARLSKGRDVSCNSCHPLDKYGVDARSTSVGHRGQVGERNAPTVYHADGQTAQFWDGRSPDLVDQAGKPITNPVEMAMRGPEDVVAVLRGIPGYVAAFQAAYPGDAEPVTFEHITESIAAFERGLITPARWDRFLEGDAAALTPDEIEGFKLFADIGCVECHTGQLIGGSMFQKAGRAKPWPTDADGGRFKVTSDEADRMVFKVPPLRNVTRTGPYFHDGSVTELRTAVEMMAEYQLDVRLSPREIELITSWLGSLTGELPWDYIRSPDLPTDAAK